MTIFNISGLTKSSVNLETNITTLIFKDADGKELTLIVNSKTRGQLILGLMARPRPDRAIPRESVLHTRGIHPILLDNVVPCLDFAIGENMFVPVAFPAEAIQHIRKALDELETGIAEKKSQEH